MIAINKETVRGFGGKILGYVESDAQGNKQARDFYGRIIANYDKSSNITRDFYGRILAHNDIVYGLLYNLEDK